MSLSRQILIFLYIIFFSLYFSWIFPNLIYLFWVFIDLEAYWQKSLITILGFVALFVIDLVIPKFISDYSIVSIWLSFGILPWLAWRNTLLSRQDMGKILFVSQYLSKTIYLMIPFTLFSCWAISRHLNSLLNASLSSNINVQGAEINSYLFSCCLILVTISTTLYCYTFSFNKLEIREQGIWYSSRITWEKITDYSWFNNSLDLLEIRHINGYQKEITSKYRIMSQEQEAVDNILKKYLKKLEK